MADEHRVEIGPARGRARARLAGAVVADSARALLACETGHAPVLYFPPADVAMARLRATERRTRCPYKGEARYWTVEAGGRAAGNAAWSYPAPIPAAAALKAHVAFYPDMLEVGLEEGGGGAVTDDAAMFAGMAGAGARLLGVDLGAKTIGLALSDPGRAVASPRETLRRGRFRGDSARIAALCAREGVGGLVVGLPRHMDGGEGARAESARAWAANLAARLSLPALMWDERLSTAAVERAMIASGMSRRRRAERIDRAAAAYILQGALDALRVVGTRVTAGPAGPRRRGG